MTWTVEDTQRFEREHTAPDGQVYVCGACGRSNKKAWEVGDESCFLNAVLCHEKAPGETTWRAADKGDGR